MSVLEPALNYSDVGAYAGTSDDRFMLCVPEGANTTSAVATAGMHPTTGAVATAGGDTFTTTTSGTCVIGTAADRPISGIVAAGASGYLFISMSDEAIRSVVDAWKQKFEDNVYKPHHLTCFEFKDVVDNYVALSPAFKSTFCSLRIDSLRRLRLPWQQTKWTDYLHLTLDRHVVLDEPEDCAIGTTLEETVAQKEWAAKLLIEEWATARHAKTDLVARIAELVDIGVDDYPESEIPNPQALSSLFGFFGELTGLRMPQMALAANGGIWAEWRDGKERAAGLEFLRNGNVSLAAYFPSPKNPLAKTSSSRTTTWNEMVSYIEQSGDLGWMFHT